MDPARTRRHDLRNICLMLAVGGNVPHTSWVQGYVAADGKRKTAEVAGDTTTCDGCWRVECGA
jgi:hypothetical protein